MGYSPASIVYNIPVPITGWTGSDGKDTWPKNYGGGDYVGPETLRNGMKRSHNVAAAQTLLTMVGVDRSVDFLMRMGWTATTSMPRPLACRLAPAASPRCSWPWPSACWAMGVYIRSRSLSWVSRTAPGTWSMTAMPSGAAAGVPPLHGMDDRGHVEGRGFRAARPPLPRSAGRPWPVKRAPTATSAASPSWA